MPELKGKRPYQERFLDNFDRAQLRREVEAVRPAKLNGLRKKYATWALGASLALGGLGVPLKMLPHGVPTGGKMGALEASSDSVDGALVKDLKAAESIALQVASGVEEGVSSVADSPLLTISAAPKTLSIVTEKVREEFFHKEVPFGSIIYKEAKKQNVRPELVAAVVQAESRFRPAARSGAGAVGLMQLVPRTGRWMGARDLTNPAQNIAAGTKYLKYLSDRFDGNETKMIAAYNAGEGNVKRFNGVPPFQETRNYVEKVQNFEQDFHSRVENRAGDAAGAASVIAEAR